MRERDINCPTLDKIKFMGEKDELDFDSLKNNELLLASHYDWNFCFFTYFDYIE